MTKSRSTAPLEDSCSFAPTFSELAGTVVDRWETDELESPDLRSLGPSVNGRPNGVHRRLLVESHLAQETEHSRQTVTAMSSRRPVHLEPSVMAPAIDGAGVDVEHAAEFAGGEHRR